MSASLFVIGANNQIRLATACDILRHYTAVGPDVSVTDTRENPMIRNFKNQQKALKDRSKDEDFKVRKRSKEFPVMKWSEVFTDFLHRVLGIRMIPLDYVSRQNTMRTQSTKTLRHTNKI